MDILDHRMDEFIYKMQMERELIDTRLGRIDDSDVIKKWTLNLLNKLKGEAFEKVDNAEKRI
jgi:hypothetical protein